MGLEHPLLGVGTGLRDAYVGEKLVAMDNKSDEMKRWIQAQKERGVMRPGYRYWESILQNLRKPGW